MKRTPIIAILMCALLLSSCRQGQNLREGEPLDAQIGQGEQTGSTEAYAVTQYG